MVECLSHVISVQFKSVGLVFFNFFIFYVHNLHVVVVNPHYHFFDGWKSPSISFHFKSPEKSVFSPVFWPLGFEIEDGSVKSEGRFTSWSFVGVSSHQDQDFIFILVHDHRHFFDVEDGQLKGRPEYWIAFLLFFEVLEFVINPDAVHGVDGDVHCLVLTLNVPWVV